MRKITWSCVIIMWSISCHWRVWGPMKTTLRVQILNLLLHLQLLREFRYLLFGSINWVYIIKVPSYSEAVIAADNTALSVVHGIWGCATYYNLIVCKLVSSLVWISTGRIVHTPCATVRMWTHNMIVIISSWCYLKSQLLRAVHWGMSKWSCRRSSSSMSVFKTPSTFVIVRRLLLENLRGLVSTFYW
jgi:hypothetical protein